MCSLNVGAAPTTRQDQGRFIPYTHPPLPQYPELFIIRSNILNLHILPVASAGSRGVWCYTPSPSYHMHIPSPLSPYFRVVRSTRRQIPAPPHRPQRIPGQARQHTAQHAHLPLPPSPVHAPAACTYRFLPGDPPHSLPRVSR